MAWQVQEAKQRFSALVRETLSEGPQVVARHGEEVVVVVSAEEFRQLSDTERDFKRFLLSAPDVELEIDREQDPAREVSL
jgi:prevent-host-death family protein